MPDHQPTIQTIETVVRFSHLVAAAAKPEQILELLAASAVEQLGASGAAVFQLTEHGHASLAASAGCIDVFAVTFIDADELGTALGERLGGARQLARTVPLVSDGDLFGALVLLFGETADLDAQTVALANALVDLASIALAKARGYAELSRAKAELESALDTLARTEKLRALGEMAAGVSHDLKNLLNPLGLQVQLLRRGADDPTCVRRVADSLERVCKRGVDTVERLRDFSRQSDDGGAEVVNLDALAEEAVELCRHRLRSRVELRLERGAPPPVLLRTSEMIAASVNLVVNALDALPPEGGTITVRTGESPFGGWFQVHDTGRGMPEDVRRRVFEPFFTTKGQQGTGLGLAMVHALVQRHGGRIDIESEVGRGTIITMAFPRAPAEGGVRASQAGAPTGRAGGDERERAGSAHPSRDLRDLMAST